MSEMNRERPSRKERIPVGSGNRLAAHQRPGFHRHWVLEIPGRVPEFEMAGYEPVHNQSANASQRKDSAMGDSVVRMHVGQGRTAILMEIPEEFYREDQAAKQAKIDATESGLRASSEEGQYGQVKIARD